MNALFCSFSSSPLNWICLFSVIVQCNGYACKLPASNRLKCYSTWVVRHFYYKISRNKPSSFASNRIQLLQISDCFNFENSSLSCGVSIVIIIIESFRWRRLQIPSSIHSFEKNIINLNICVLVRDLRITERSTHSPKKSALKFA